MTAPMDSKVGVTEVLGSHRFEADEIIRFASKYDPQRFHIDEEAARQSQYGRLCASGWHTASTFMRVLIANRDRQPPNGDRLGIVEYGPSPGIRDLKWLKPVYAGDTITYSYTTTGIRPTASRPGWSLLTSRSEAHNQDGEKVMECTHAALVRVE